MSDVVEIRDLAVTFQTDAGPVRAVDGVSLAVHPGAVSYTHLTLPTNREV